MRKKTLKNIIIILFFLSFFVTPLGHYGKIGLNRLFAGTAQVIPQDQRTQILDYDWKLKDENWDFFNFKEAEGKVVFINFWASWRVPSEAELYSIEKLYKKYGDKVSFYIITNEEKEPVVEFMDKKGFDFPLTYLVIGEKMPIKIQKIPSTYIIDKKGFVCVERLKNADWNTPKIHQLLDELVAQ